MSEATAAGAARQDHRPLIVGASLATGVVGLVPVPLANDLAIGALRALLVRRLAGLHGLELSTHAALLVAGQIQPSQGRLALSAVLSLGLRLAWRRASRALLILLRLDDVGQTFLLGTFFDRYCLRHHPGGPIDAGRADEVRLTIQAASTRARRQLLSALFGRVLDDLWRAGGALPGTLWAYVVAGGEPATEPASFLARLADRIERELSAVGESTDAALKEAFDRAWASQHPTTPITGASR